MTTGRSYEAVVEDEWIGQHRVIADVAAAAYAWGLADR